MAQTGFVRARIAALFDSAGWFVGSAIVLSRRLDHGIAGEFQSPDVVCLDRPPRRRNRAGRDRVFTAGTARIIHSTRRDTKIVEGGKRLSRPRQPRPRHDRQRLQPPGRRLADRPAVRSGRGAARPRPFPATTYEMV